MAQYRNTRLWQLRPGNNFRQLGPRNPQPIVEHNEKNEAEALQILGDEDVNNDAKEYHVLRLSNSSTTRRQIYENKIKDFARPADQSDTIRLILQDIAKDDDDHREEFDVLCTAVHSQPAAVLFRFNQNNDSHPCFMRTLYLEKNAINEALGYGIQTKQSLSVGEKIVVSKPFAWALPNNIDKPYCLTCGIINVPLSPCRKCSRAFFCSVLCQHSNKAHQYECTTAFHSYEIDVNTKCAIQMVLQSIAAFRNENGDNIEEMVKYTREAIDTPRNDWIRRMTTIDARSKYTCILHLQTILPRNWTEHEIAFNMLIGLPRVAEIFNTRNYKYFLQHLLGHCIGALKCNGFSIQIGGHSARAIYDIVSFFNHSCTPNVGTRFKGSILHLMVNYSVIKKPKQF